MTFHPEILTAAQRAILMQLGPSMSRHQFYLGGGTAIALQLGHRHSVDLDWFTGERLADPLRLAQELRDEGIPLITDQVEPGPLQGALSGVRLSFLEYRYPLLQPPLLWPDYGCHIASLDDLACMKLAAVAQRGSKKDFVDVYALGLKHLTLPEMLRLYQARYSLQDIGHDLYSLAYFTDADRERLPKMLWDVDWRAIKSTIQEWVREATD